MPIFSSYCLFFRTVKPIAMSAVCVYRGREEVDRENELSSSAWESVTPLIAECSVQRWYDCVSKHSFDTTEHFNIIYIYIYIKRRLFEVGDGYLRVPAGRS